MYGMGICLHFMQHEGIRPIQDTEYIVEFLYKLRMNDIELQGYVHVGEK